MVAFSTLLAASAALAGVSAKPADLGRDLHKRLTSSSTGTNNGYYYSFWVSGSDVTYENGNGGEYSVTWTSGSENFVAGKGWSTGAERSVNFDADFNPDGNAYLSVYGWTTSPLVEYYILENYGEYNPGSAATHMGTVDADGSTYDIYKTTRTNAASIEGDGQTFEQYWSIRQDLRSSGTVTTSTHFAAWENLGMSMGSFGSGAYQIVATEGYESAGSSTVTVS